MILYEMVDIDKAIVLCHVRSCIIDSIGLLSGYVNKYRDYLMIDNKTIENQTIYKECFRQATITNTKFRNCTFFCVGGFLDIVFENCIFENWRFINCTMEDTFLQNVAFFNCNMLDSMISAVNSKISSVWRIGCKTTYRRFKGYEELFI